MFREDALRLEPGEWSELERIALLERTTVQRLIEALGPGRDSLASAARELLGRRGFDPERVDGSRSEGCLTERPPEPAHEDLASSD